MLAWIRKTMADRARRRADRERERAAVARALACFTERYAEKPLGAYVLARGPDAIVIRVMFFAGHIPPKRAWFAVQGAGEPVRELSFEDVRSIDTAIWR